MEIIVAGKLYIKPGMREKFISRSLCAIELARDHEFCEDFSVSQDPLEPNRVNVFERWSSRSALEQFRAMGPDDTLSLLVEDFDVAEFEVNV